MFLDAPKALMGLCEFWCPICSWTGGTLGLMFPTVSVLGLHVPNITCLCCHQILQEKLFSWGGNAWTGAFYIPMTHSTQALWKCSCEQHVLVAHKGSLHPAVACQVQLWGPCWDGLFVRLDTVLTEERQCLGWAVPDGEGECNTLARWSYFFASRKIINSCFQICKSACGYQHIAE